MSNVIFLHNVRETESERIEREALADSFSADYESQVSALTYLIGVEGQLDRPDACRLLDLTTALQGVIARRLGI